MIQVIRQYPCNIGEIVKKASENGETKLATAGKGVMFNVPKFYQECTKYNIVPIIGCEFPLDNGRTISLFAKDNEGYKNLIAISYEVSKNPLTMDFLRNHSDGLGLILDISTCKLTELVSKEDIRKYLAEYQRLFSLFKLGLPYGESYKELISKIKEFVKDFPYDLVAFPHMLYEKSEDAIVLEIVNAISNA